MKTWNQWMYHWLELKHSFEPSGGEPAPFPLPSDSRAFGIDWLSDLESGRQPVLESAILQFADTGVFPPLDSCDTLLMGARISHALRIAAANDSRFPPDEVVVPRPVLEDQSMTEWFLIHAWEPIGKTDWLEDAAYWIS